MRIVAGVSELATRLRVIDARTGEQLANVEWIDDARLELGVWDFQAWKRGERAEPPHPEVVKAERIEIDVERAIARVTFPAPQPIARAAKPGKGET